MEKRINGRRYNTMTATLVKWKNNCKKDGTVVGSITCLEKKLYVKRNKEYFLFVSGHVFKLREYLSDEEIKTFDCSPGILLPGGKRDFESAYAQKYIPLNEEQLEKVLKEW